MIAAAIAALILIGEAALFQHAIKIHPRFFLGGSLELLSWALILRHLSDLSVHEPMNVTEPFANSSYRCAGGRMPLHAGGYGELRIQLEMKLSDEPIVCADSEDARLNLLPGIKTADDAHPGERQQ